MLASPERVKENLRRLEEIKKESTNVFDAIGPNFKNLAALYPNGIGNANHDIPKGNREEMHALLVDESVERFKKSIATMSWERKDC